MKKEQLDSCFKCHSDNVEFVLVFKNSRGGEIYKIKCNDCGLCSPDESKERLVRFWNDRKAALPANKVLQAFAEIDKAIAKKGKLNPNTVKSNLETIQEYIGITEKGGSKK